MCFSLLFSLQQHSAPPFRIYFLSSHLKVNYLWIVKDYRRTTAGSLISPPGCYCNDTRTYPQITWITNRFLFCRRSPTVLSLPLIPLFFAKLIYPKADFSYPSIRLVPTGLSVSNLLANARAFQIRRMCASRCRRLNEPH